MLGLWLLCVLWGHVWCGISWHASNTRCQKVVVLKCVFAFKVPLNVRASKVVVLKGEYGYVKFNI
nr:MAG TPA: hypothetical protein [Caudoviricetes sp.]